MKHRRDELLAKAVTPGALQSEGPLTLPRSWGVYRIEPPNPSSTRRFRKGNHPIRQRELEGEFGKADVIALFTEEALAIELAKLLNDDVSAASIGGAAPMSRRPRPSEAAS